ncbi:hypothetical protein SESBI_29342 [Sesbania bispinosa]|nr:hypothetical protein SESBI_29342 [Sesbania bispinosa]
MGLEILEEFRPIMPIRTVATTRTFNQPDPETTKGLKEEQECHTPPHQILRTPLVCPPAPKKPRVARRTNFTAPSQGFFQVPDDLASVFLLPTTPERALC